MRKRILSIILALCMVFCLVPTTALAATQTAGSWSELQTLINQTNNLSVTLSSDISWGGSSLTVPTGKTVTVDLNGKAIDAKSNGTVLVVNGTLTIKNSGADLAGPIGVGAGPITGNIKNGKASDKEAGGILVADGGKLVMNSGWLTNCVDGSGKTSAAGGIYVSKNAVFEMTGGIITGCVGSDLLCAAGVVNYGTFTMSGNATISGSKTSYNTDGVAICNAGTMNANGGTVQTGQKCTNYDAIQNAGRNATVFYCNVLNTGLGTIKGGTYHYPVENAGTITGGTFNEKVTSSGTINDGIFNGTVDNTRVVTGGTFNGTTTGIYTVTFNSGVPSQIRANCPATAPDAPTKRGYIFNGWLNGGTPYDFTQNVTQNIYLTADWTPKSYTVKFDTNGGTAIADKTLTWDDKVLDGVSDPEKPGYDFAGWTFDGGNVLTRTTYANLAADDTVTSITLTAQWTLHLYTVTLDANGGTFDASGSTVAQDTMQVTYGGNFEQIPIPRYKGYFFRGWYDEQWGGRQYGDEDGRGTYTYDKTEDCTLYALWEEAPLCTVTFNPNGGTLTGAETCQEKQNERIQRPYEEPIREGYYFRGWYKDADCTQMWDFDDPIPGNMTLYAGWDILSYVIRVRLENGEQDIIINQNYGTPVTVPDDPTREGYTFIGWDIPFPAKMPAKITTITAQWTINQYTITFDTAGGSEIDSIEQDYDTAITAPDAPTKEGYTFIGWDTTVPKKMPAKDMTVKARWQINRYKITFDTDGGSEIDPIEQDYDTAITAPDNPTKEGYAFIDWDTTVPAKMPARDMTIKALWKDIEKPTGKISLDTNEWKTLLNTITFGLFFKDTQTVTITATDNSGDAVKIEYLLSAKELTEAELASAAFTAYTAPFGIDPDNEYIIYVRLTDNAGNTDYICSDGIVLDGTSPVITGIENGKTYCEAQTVTVDEKHIDTVTVNGKEVTLDENGSFVLSPADGEQKIVVTDKAGNTAEMTVTVNDGHTFDEWTSNGDGTHTRQCTADGCTEGVETDNCTDEDKNHICDICGNIISNHEDANQDHVCDLCGKVISNHEDADNNHICDYCDKVISNHEDADEDHVCDFCGKTISNHEDANKDHVCDYCGKVFSNHEDADKDHVCDHCGKVISNHEDADKDHVCDYCEKIISNHEDANKDHVCDYCEKVISNHEDADKDHVCDYCEKIISNHEDANKDHVCDYCEKVISNHEDADKDHVCDYCEKIISNHEDANKDHVCDYCEKVISNHEDADKDHVCDLCGKVITNHAGGKETCRDKAVCEVCGKAYGELDPKNHTDLKHFPAKAATEDAEGNVEYWHCDDCNKYYSDKDGTKELKKADTVTSKLPKSPQTGDNSNLMLWIALLLISGGALIGTTVTEKKKKQK
ncbi:MAG: InlB B-repeat-containing protein [Eubacteriales bacterium]